MTTTKAIKKTVICLVAAVAAVILLATGVWGGMYYSNNMQIDSVISLDVNPSIEITANKRDTVMDVKAVNADAVAVLDGLELNGVNLNTAVNAIIGSMLKQGYLNNGENEILVSVQNSDPVKMQVLQNLIDDTLSGSVNVPVTNRAVENSAEAKALAEREKISVGKAAYILEMTAANPSLNASELAGMSIQELNALHNNTRGTEQTAQNQTQESTTSADIQSENSTSSSGNSNASAGSTTASSANSKPTQQASQTTTAANAQTGEITQEKAKQIALQHAGLSADKVTFIKVHLDYEDGIRVYDVEFYSGNTEYDYEINAQTGAIHSFDRDIENYIIPGNSNSAGNSSSTVQGASISADKAKQIALQHAGLSADSVSYVKVELDYEHGLLVYELEFRKGFIEYDYEINAQTGEILKYERDWD